MARSRLLPTKPWRIRWPKPHSKRPNENTRVVVTLAVTKGSTSTGTAGKGGGAGPPHPA